MFLKKTLDSFQLGNIELKNRLVMAPMTRCRAIDHIPNELMAEYYAQRANAGLIITEGTAPSPNGLGYARIPGCFSDEQVDGWKLVTDAVHNNNGRIFLQIMHTGRVSHPLNMPENSEILAPSAIQLDGKMYTDQEGEQDYPIPKEMTTEDIQQAKNEFLHTAKQAIKAGFDGVELHAANGYLLNQFISPVTNQRTDNYGGSIENRLKFVVETAQLVTNAIGADRVGIRISPYGVFSGMAPFEDIDKTYTQLVKEMNRLKLAYVHVVDHSAIGAPEVPVSIKDAIRENFDNAYILSGGYDGERAEADLQADKGDLVAFGRPYIANPDLAYRIENGIELAEPDHNTFYTPGKEGYTDYPKA